MESPNHLFNSQILRYLVLFEFKVTRFDYITIYDNDIKILNVSALQLTRLQHLELAVHPGSAIHRATGQSHSGQPDV